MNILMARYFANRAVAKFCFAKLAKADGGVERIDSNRLRPILTPYGALRVQVLSALSRTSCFGSHLSRNLVLFYIFHILYENIKYGGDRFTLT